MEVYREVCDLDAIVNGVIDQMREPASAKGILLSVKFEHALGKGSTDVRKLRQIVRIVLENAVKFTGSGVVSLLANRNEASQLVITVKDTGIGISEQRLATLFEQFYEGDDATGSKYGGTGLGLALGQKLSRLLGGEIRVESKEGEGSCFTICLPVGDEPAEQAAAPATAQVRQDNFNLDSALLRAAHA